jgi:hypothetical protein
MIGAFLVSEASRGLYFAKFQQETHAVAFAYGLDKGMLLNLFPYKL